METVNLINKSKKKFDKLNFFGSVFKAKQQIRGTLVCCEHNKLLLTKLGKIVPSYLPKYNEVVLLQMSLRLFLLKNEFMTEIRN